MSKRYEQYLSRVSTGTIHWVGKTRSGHTRVLVPGAAITIKAGTKGLGKVAKGQPLPAKLAKGLSYGGDSQFFVGFPRPQKAQAVEVETATA
jgi:hypothetical protein